ncbi:MAG: site-specific integrase [Erysipelotrichaceae bacterium]|nr:site-specific integrase [Erysipelotrichaceae bacterium]
MEKLTFEDAIPQYLSYIKLKIKDSTYENNERIIKTYILKYFKSKSIYDLNLIDFINWQNYINEFNFSYDYKSNLFYNFSGFLDYCILFYDLKNNVAKMFGNFKDDTIKKQGNIWTLEQFNYFINSIKDPIYHCLFNFLYFTGLRKGELLALNFNDIDFNNGTLNVYKQLTKKGTITTPKTKKSNRIIYLDEYLINEVKVLKDIYRNKYINFKNNDFVFGCKKYISFTTLKRKKDLYCKNINLEPIKIHEFRHSHAVLLYQNNIPIVDIKNRLGHENINTTIDTYLKYLPKDNEKRVINTLNSIRLKSSTYENNLFFNQHI